MQRSLEHLKSEIASFQEAPGLDAASLEDFIANCIVVLTAGGEGSRLRSLTDAQRVNKSAMVLPNGDTMIQRTIRMYRVAGFRRFVVLVYHQAHSIVDLLGDGSSLGVSLSYSYDPDRPVGKGGAVLNALLNGSIPRTGSMIVQNPDDQIINYPGSFPRDIAEGHVHGVSQGMLATAVVVKGTPYPYTGMKIRDNVIEEIEMYPTIPIPTHVGVTLFSPDVYSYFDGLFDITKKADFEAVLFPALASLRRLYAVHVPESCWVPVNDPKSLKLLVESIEDE